jgi:hypothetical protein
LPFFLLPPSCTCTERNKYTQHKQIAIQGRQEKR